MQAFSEVDNKANSGLSLSKDVMAFLEENSDIRKQMKDQEEQKKANKEKIRVIKL